MKKFIIAIITGFVAISAFANDEALIKELRAKVHIALYEKNAADVAAYTAAINNLQQAKLAEIEQKEAAIRVEYAQKLTHIYKNVPNLARAFKLIAQMQEPEEKLPYSDTNIGVKIVMTIHNMIESGNLDFNEVQKIGELIKKSDEQWQKQIRERNN